MKGVRPLKALCPKMLATHLDQTRHRKRQNEGVKLCLRAFHVILLQEATTRNEEVTIKAKEQFHLYYGADQLILFHKTFFESGTSFIESELCGTSSSACSCSCTLTRKCDVSRRDVCSKDLITPRTGRLMFPNLMLRALPR